MVQGKSIAAETARSKKERIPGENKHGAEKKVKERGEYLLFITSHPDESLHPFRAMFFYAAALALYFIRSRILSVHDHYRSLKKVNCPADHAGIMQQFAALRVSASRLRTKLSYAGKVASRGSVCQAIMQSADEKIISYESGKDGTNA